MVRTAVIGVGYLGRFHAQKYKQLTEMNECQLIGVLDENPERTKLVADELKVRAFKNFDELKAEVDAVSIASTTQTHFVMAKQALQAGLHVNVEKPMTVTLAEADELLNIAEKMKLQIAVGHSERFNPIYQDLAQKFTKPTFLEFRRHAPFRLRGSDVSVVLDLMIHDLDLAAAWAGDLKLVTAVGGKMHSPSLDWAEAEFISANGVRVRISASRTASAMSRTVRGIQQMTNFHGNFQTMELEELEWQPQQEEPKRKRQETLGKLDHLLLENRGFLKAIAGDTSTLWISGQDGRRALSLALEVEKTILS